MYQKYGISSVIDSDFKLNSKKTQFCINLAENAN